MTQKIIVKCEKCGSVNVYIMKMPDPPPKPEPPRVISMKQHVKENKSVSESPFIFQSSDTAVRGTSHIRKMIIQCGDCGYKIEWDQVVYT